MKTASFLHHLEQRTGDLGKPIVRDSNKMIGLMHPLFTCLDQMLFMPAGTSLRSFARTYLPTDAQFSDKGQSSSSMHHLCDMTCAACCRLLPVRIDS